MKKTILAALLFCAAAITASSQSIDVFDMQTGTYGEVTATAPFLMTNRFIDNTFVSAAIGFNVYFGEDDSYGGKRAGSAWEISFGKWTSPFLGLRAQFSRSRGNGWSGHASPYQFGDPDADGYYREEFKIMNIRGDLLIDPANIFKGYTESRFMRNIPFLGFGIGRSAANGHSNVELNVNVGVLNIFRLNDNFDATAELRYMAVKSRFDGVAAGKKADGQLALTFGVSYKIGAKGFRRPVKLLPQ